MIQVEGAIQETVKIIDWALLREQKQWLFTHTNDHADGLIALLDAIQDAAVIDGSATTQEVFGGFY